MLSQERLESIAESTKNIQKYLKDIAFRQRIYLFLLGIFIGITAFFIYDMYRVSALINKKELLVSKDKVSADDILPTISETEPQEAPKEKVCEYKYLLTEVVNEPEDSDKKQKVIGYPNNKVGVYIYAEVEEFTKLAAFMVNSNGGEWGYVLVPYNVKDRDENRWGKLFHNLRDYKLIPIIQLHDGSTDYERAKEQIHDAADFLNSLEWPVKNRYITVFNEVNDEKFYSGKIDPEGYAKILNYTIDTFKAKNSRFFIMNGAFNASARSGHGYLDEKEYLKQMDEEVGGIFKKLDGWASHPYPQPNFTGSPKARGRDSIRAYEWELSILKNEFDVDTNKLPVFITETGWPHSEGDEPDSSYLDQYKVADNLKYAFENVWMPDDRVVAVTPFTIKYDPPHDHFSFVTKDLTPYAHFLAIQDIKKEKGKPPTVDYIKAKVLECE